MSVLPRPSIPNSLMNGEFPRETLVGFNGRIRQKLRDFHGEVSAALGKNLNPSFRKIIPLLSPFFH